MQVLSEVFVYVSALYFAYVFIAKKDLDFLSKVGLVILLLPITILLPTSYLFTGVDLSTCVISETPALNFLSTYAIEILLSFLILFTSFWGISRQPARKKEIILFTTGLIIFLIAFSSGNIVGSLTEDWDTAQAGLFGMPVFIAFLTYTVVRFKTFNVKLFATQALVASIAVLIAARLFYSTTTAGTILSVVTLVGFLISGVFLVRSVKREIAQREHIEKLAGELAQTNERQETLIHFIGHEVKGFLTKDMSAFAAISQGDFGAPPDGMKPFVDHALAESRVGVDSVSNILKASNLKKGTVTYTKEPVDLATLVAVAVQRAKPAAEAKHLSLNIMTDPAGAPYMVSADKDNLSEHVLRNLIDNAVNYTPSGSVDIFLKKESGKVIFSVKDTGVGITEEDKKRLFTEGGHGRDSQRINAHSTGYGLYIAKQIVEAHGGTIRAESEGEGKGSTFIVELPT
ncbi:MAG: Histidine kinase-, DNA gyrase B-, and [Parcubacteria group bacterium GW2011_GWB1_57_6]|nr:MAG: Histidine kinase-, DNA gyrase B-, and [Parcubacteria group bacterium GW2011_GWA1_56_13]KKW46627.1 MAG: Histidine kinase-, DNA gyrase B-, and [Parcubacteria group bacterium GW2011_GWB1_57_6]